MIPDWKTSQIYFSDLLPKHYPKVFKSLALIIRKLGYPIKFIPKTKDIWVRDFMPIKLSNGLFINYQYSPDYLTNHKDITFRSDPEKICELMTIQTKNLQVILDGGNIIKSENSIILTDKVFHENPKYSRKKLESKIKESFEVENIIFIPWDKADRFGHADGMVRFINNETVLIQGYFKLMNKRFQNSFFEAIEKANLNWLELKFENKNQHRNNWAYINFLQTKDFIIVPELGIPEDIEALNQIQQVFNFYPPNKIIPLRCSELINQGGGGLNCISWTT